MSDNPISTPPAPPPTAEELLAQLVAQQTQANLLRRLELDQQTELTRATMAKAQAEAEAARQLAEANAINRRQIEVVEKLLADVEEWVQYFKSGKAEKAFGMVTDKLSRLTHVVETMIMNRPEDETKRVLLQIIQGETPVTRATGPLRTRSSSNLYINEDDLVSALLECATFQSSNSFETLKNDLSMDISSRVKPGDNILVQTRNLVRVCVQNNALPQLIEALRFYEKGSVAFDNVLRLVNG